MRVLLSTVLAIAALASGARAQCSPATLTVTGTYSVNGQVSPMLTLGEGIAYTFECSGVSGIHPLILTSSTTGGTLVGQMTAAQVPGYTPGGTCSTCVQNRFTITPGPSTPATLYYNCHVHAGLGDMIMIKRKPAISQQPQGSLVCRGGMLTLTVGATIPGGGTPTFQWRRNAQPIAGQTGSMLMVHGFGPANAGLYDCVVSNACANVTSNAIQVAVCPADVDDGNATGVCDGAVTIDDLLFYLGAFESGSAPADVDNGSASGTSDGAVTIDDLVYFLARFEAGC